MIHDFDKTLEKIIYTEGKINRKEVDISFELPNGDWSARLSRPTIDCWCFDLRENMKLRNMERQVARNGNMGKISLPPRRFDLSYLVTAWARKIEDEHQLLWRALGALKRVPTLQPGECEGNLRYQTKEIPLFVGTRSEDHPVNLVDLWSVLSNDMRLGFTVVATIELDTELEFDAPLVLEKHIRVGQSQNPEEEELTVLDTELVQKGKPEDLARKEGRR